MIPTDAQGNIIIETREESAKRIRVHTGGSHPEDIHDALAQQGIHNVRVVGPSDRVTISDEDNAACIAAGHAAARAGRVVIDVDFPGHELVAEALKSDGHEVMVVTGNMEAHFVDPKLTTAFSKGRQRGQLAMTTLLALGLAAGAALPPGMLDACRDLPLPKPPTQQDLDRIAAAEEKRARKAAKRSK